MDKYASHPCVLNIGFAGSRFLYNNEELEPGHQVRDEAAFMASLRQQLAEKLAGLRARLALGQEYQYFFISQLAIGGDMLLAEICRDEDYAMQLFLPQHWDAYLEARGSDGVPDFTEAQKAEASKLRDSPNILQERVVSDAEHRKERFHETNLKILRHSDLVVCLIRGTAREAGRGGTQSLIVDARNRGLPMLELYVHVKDGMPRLEERWTRPAVHYLLPVLPPEIPFGDTGDVLAKAEEMSRLSRIQFREYALLLVGTHLLATAAAAGVLMLGSYYYYARVPQDGVLVNWLLASELILLVTGFAMHYRFHHRGVPRQWAYSRLIGEILRSVSAVRGFRMRLDYLRIGQYPRGFIPYLRTLNYLHLRDPDYRQKQDWEGQRARYLDERLESEASGQLHYYAHCMTRDRRRIRLANRLFYVFVSLALLATGIKFLKAMHWLPVSDEVGQIFSGPLGFIAVVFPALAVGMISLVAAFDLEGRVHTYREMVTWLRRQAEKIRGAQSETEFLDQVQETEAQLMSEILNWYNRRTHTGVA